MGGGSGSRSGPAGGRPPEGSGSRPDKNVNPGGKNDCQGVVYLFWWRSHVATGDQ